MDEPRKKPVLILTGAPGAGKTTAARILAGSSERAVHIEADSFFHFIRTGYIEPWKPESHGQNAVVMHIVAEVAAGYARAGYLTIIDGIISPGWFFEPVRDSLEQAGFPVAYAILRPPLDVCLSRAAPREPAQVADPGVVERLWQDFADLGALERHVIDTDTGAADTADLLARRLDDGLLLATA